ncbi:MAG: hypothetical protein JWR75_261 [Devosia sp.]|nr:hypothetical protein [Devosia sp.]
MPGPVLKSPIATLAALLLMIGTSAFAPSLAQDAVPDTAVIEEGTAGPVLPAVIAVRVSTTPERARMVVDLNFQTEFALVSLDNPGRIAIDLKAAGLMFTESPPISGSGLVAAFDMVMAEPGRARALLTLATPAQVQQAYFLEAFDDQPARLVIDLIPATHDEFAKRVADDLAASEAAKQGVAIAEPTAPGVTNLPPETRPLVVIDPGHGGVDGGAEGPNGVEEKTITLAFALKLQEVLIASGRFDVALTREDDSFLKLEDRVGLARENKADLFISIHADSFQQPDIRGASVYTRDENATDVLDKVLADEENKVDLVAGFAAPDMDAAVVDILVDLMQRSMRKQSFLAAEAIVHALEPSVELRKFPVRQADFFVLQAPDIPSMLIELGFLSNTDDALNLTQGEWQGRTADAVARGVAAYFDAEAALLTASQ